MQTKDYILAGIYGLLLYFAFVHLVLMDFMTYPPNWALGHYENSGTAWPIKGLAYVYDLAKYLTASVLVALVILLTDQCNPIKVAFLASVVVLVLTLWPTMRYFGTPLPVHNQYAVFNIALHAVGLPLVIWVFINVGWHNKALKFAPSGPDA